MTAHFSFDSTSGDEIPAEVWELFSRPVWHNTDGWRGYDDVKLTVKGLLTLEPVARGWVTGMPDGTTRYKVVACDLAERLKELGNKVPFTMWWVFSVTSNLFSLASDLYVAKDDMPAFKQWCKTQGFEIAAIAGAFE
jgi:hypothetical protein